MQSVSLPTPSADHSLGTNQVQLSPQWRTAPLRLRSEDPTFLLADEPYGCAPEISDFKAALGRAHHWCEGREGIQGTWDAGKNLTDPDEQVLRDLPPDGQWCCVVQVQPDLLGHGLVVIDVL